MMRLNFIVIYFAILFTAIYCNPPELKIQSIVLCENFSSEGVCREKLEIKQSYNINVNQSKKFETWEALSNYLYFHSRQTPGFIVRFNRKFTLSEKELIRKTYKAKYNFYGYSGHVEGFEMGEDWVGSFQYLGSIVKDRQRFFREEKNYPYTETLFPSELKFNFDSELGKGEITTEVNVNLIYNE